MERFQWIEVGKASAPTGESPVFTSARDCYREARRLREGGCFRAAATQYEHALGFDEHRHGTWIELIDSLVRGGDLVAADLRSREALANYGQVRGFYAARALALAYRGSLREALTQSDISMEGDDTGWYARCVRAEVLLASDASYRPEALRLLEEALGMPGDLWETNFLGGWAFMRADLPTFAASFFAESAHARPRSFISWFCLGEAFRLLKLYDQAMFYYHRAEELAPAHELLANRMKGARLKTYGLMQTFLAVELRERWKRLWEEYDPPRDFEF